MHNYVVRGHHDGNISVRRLHNGSLSLCILLCAVVIKWMLTQSVMPSREIQLVLVFTNLSTCLPPTQKKKPVRKILTRRTFDFMTERVNVFLARCCKAFINLFFFFFAIKPALVYRFFSLTAIIRPTRCLAVFFMVSYFFIIHVILTQQVTEAIFRVNQKFQGRMPFYRKHPFVTIAVRFQHSQIS